MSIRLGALRLYRQHLIDQYADRCALWSLRDVSSDAFARTVTIVTDGADQATWQHAGSFYRIWYWLVGFCPFIDEVGSKLGLQQAKYQIPRDPELRTAHRLAKGQRPKLKLHACWAYGHVLRVAILEETSYAGSSMIQELIALTVEDIMQECSLKGVSPPDTLVLCGDNTVKELKNSYNLTFCASLALHQKFRPICTRLFVLVLIEMPVAKTVEGQKT